MQAQDEFKDFFEKGIEYFNSGYYFEAHDTFEEIWMDARGDGVKFYQGLVQLATGFYHLRMGNLKGAASQLGRGVEKLKGYKPVYRQLELAALLNRVKDCIDLIEKNGDTEGLYHQIRSKIPKLLGAKIER